MKRVLSTVLFLVMCLVVLPDMLNAHAGKGCCGGGGKSSGSSQKRAERRPSMPQSRAPQISSKKKRTSRSVKVVDASVSTDKKQSRWSAWWKPKKTLNTMNYDELRAAKERYIAEKNIPSAIRFLERMVKECVDLNERRAVLLELADLLFETEKFERAGDLYKEFAKYYSGSEKIEYATYKSIVCSYKYIAELDRDQSKTVETIELAQEFLNRGEIFKTHVEGVQTIFAACMQRLFESELYVADFYIHRGRYVSAHKRIDTIRKKFVPAVPAAESHILTMECVLAEKLNDSARLLVKQAELREKFPANTTMVVAQDLKAKTRSFVNRF